MLYFKGRFLLFQAQLQHNQLQSGSITKINNAFRTLKNNQ